MARWQMLSQECTLAIEFKHAEIFEEASLQIRVTEDLKQTSETLRKALALSSSLSTVRAWQAMAAQEAALSNLGIACANLQVYGLD